MRLWVGLLITALLLAGLPVQGQGGPRLDVAVEDVAWSYGPETWKEDGAPQSLGTRVDVTTTVTLDDGRDAPEDWEYSATLTDGRRLLEGIPVTDDSGLRFAFDVDGGRPAAGAPRAPLVAGDWHLRIEATSSDPLGLETTVEGWGTGTLATRGLDWDSLERLQGDTKEDLHGVKVPPGVLPGIQETGGDLTWFAAPVLRVGDSFLATVDAGEAGVPIHWTAWQPVDGIPGVSPLFEEIPLGDTLTGLDGTSTWAVTATGSTHLLAVAAIAQDEAGGSAVFALGTGDSRAAITAVSAPTPGGSGPVAVTVANATMGTVHALGGRDAPLSTGPLVLSGNAATAVLDPTPMRSAAIPGYDLLALTGPGGERYQGHAVLARGLDVGLEIPSLGEGRTATITATFTNLDAGPDGPGRAIAANASLTMDGKDQGSHTFQVPAGGVLQKEWKVKPQEVGSTPFRITVDTGDLLFQVRATETVVTAEEHDDARRPWYDPQRYIPGPPMPLLLAAIALLVRQQKR